MSALGLVKRGDSMAPLGGSPRLVLLFSGKRKSGKDFVTEALQSRCPRVQGSRRKGATASGGHDRGGSPRAGGAGRDDAGQETVDGRSHGQRNNSLHTTSSENQGTASAEF